MTQEPKRSKKEREREKRRRTPRWGKLNIRSKEKGNSVSKKRNVGRMVQERGEEKEWQGGHSDLEGSEVVSRQMRGSMNFALGGEKKEKKEKK